MVAIVHPPGSGVTSNRGSSDILVSYLSKEKDSTLGFFTHREVQIPPIDVQEALDANCGQLGRKDSKFYMLSLNPSHEELCSVIGRFVNEKSDLTEDEIGKIEEYLKELTYQSMNAYAENFQRDKVKSADDILYFARIESKRTYKPTHKNIRERCPIWRDKNGLNFHVHIIVSRKSRDGSTKLSPNSVSQGNHWELKGRGVVGRGFNKGHWVQAVQSCSDKILGIQRTQEDSISKCTNSDIRELSEYKFEKANYVVQEMKARGYKAYHRNGAWVFSRGKEVFSIESKDLKYRETRLTADEKMNAWADFSRGDSRKIDFSYTVKEKIERQGELVETGREIHIEERYLCSHKSKVLANYSECYYMSRKMETKEEVLDQLPDGNLKKILSTGEVYSFSERIKQLEDAGYKHSFLFYHTFRKDGEPEIRIQHPSLIKFSGISQETIVVIAKRFDIKYYRQCKDKTTYNKDGLVVQERTYKKRDSNEMARFYVIRDMYTNSVVKLSAVYKQARMDQQNSLSFLNPFEIDSSRIKGYMKSTLIQHTIAREAAPLLQGVQTVQSISRFVSSDPATAVTRELMAQVKKILLSSLKQI